MPKMLDFYQNLPQHIDPIAFSIGFFSVRWYSLMYLLAFMVIYMLLRWRVARDAKDLKFSNKVSNPKVQILDLVFDWMAYSITGLLIGARLGHIFFYNFQYYFQNPLAILSLYDFSSGNWIGIFGMSYFGGAIGVLLASVFFVKRKKISFWDWADFVVPVVPAGYFFGRVGNFLNGELYGQLTKASWGMHFGIGELTLRHPSQLYEAFFEGLVLFLILWFRRNKMSFKGESLAIYLFFYGLFRFGIEFFREPDFESNLFWGWMTLGQILALIFVGLGIFLGISLSKRGKAL